MSFFDVTEFSEKEIPRRLVSEANDGIEKLRMRLVDEIKLSILPPLLLRSSAQAFFQGHIRRSLMFIEGGHDAYLAKRGLVAVACSRAVYETVACVFDFCDKFNDHLIENDFPKTASFLFSRLNAARMPDFVSKEEDGFENVAINILTQIDRVSKHFPGMREQYDLLSEMTHPNALGALHHFWESGDEIIRFSKGEDKIGAMRSLVGAGYLLSHMNSAILLIEDKLAKHKVWPSMGV